ncbi:hypothetical protein GQ44DRAFT_698088 [Phaeosphaeriaceae sp. PMI808]|nr:hypothetical protein GQ44DRAFT_698088 [Phaeosphaeriaceae sp. PMI808]
MTITFGAICSFLQSVENISKRQPRLPPKQERDVIREITTNWFINQRQDLDDPTVNGGAVLSALFPHRRKDRVYGLQAPLLAKRLTTLLDFSHGQKALFNDWKTGQIGDLGAYTERAMATWDGTFQTKQVIPIERIERLLVQLAAKYRFSDAAVRKQRDWQTNTNTEMKNIFIRLESWEAKWLVRLLLRDHSTIELDERHVCGQYHFLLPDLLMFQNDFDAVFGMLRRELSGYPATPLPSEETALRIEAAQKLNAVVGVKVGRPTFYKAWSFEHCFRLLGNRAWASEIKYDGEYCEIHVDMDQSPNNIKIFSKNGKDATTDRGMLHSTIRSALRMGRADCLFKSKCVVLGEMVVYSDREKKILPFSKIRKHVSRSGSFLGTWQDSLPHAWEHLMIVFFDVLVVDSQATLRHSFQNRRNVLRKLVSAVPGRSMRSEWTLLDFKAGGGMEDLKQAFARTLARRQEGLVLKPLHAPYFPLLTEQGNGHAKFFVKMKKDYLGDMGGERDFGDFAVVGASFDPQIAPQSGLIPLHWTHFYLGCCMNQTAVRGTGAKTRFKIVAVLGLDTCIPKSDVKYLNIQGYVRQVPVRSGGLNDVFEVEYCIGLQKRMTVVFKKPFVAEVLGGGFEKLPNEDFEMLRHPRMKKVHHDRTWEDCVTMEDLVRMADEKWGVPDADKLVDGHARDVALLAKKYAKRIGSSQVSMTTDDTTQGTTQQTTPRTTQETPEVTVNQTVHVTLAQTSDAVVDETQQQSHSSVTAQYSEAGSTQRRGINASRESRILVREDTSDRLTEISSTARPITEPSKPPQCITETAMSVAMKRSFTAPISPPTIKRRRVLSLLDAAGANRNLGSFDFDSQNKTIHIYANKGLKVRVHTNLLERNIG